MLFVGFMFVSMCQTKHTHTHTHKLFFTQKIKQKNNNRIFNEKYIWARISVGYIFVCCCWNCFYCLLFLLSQRCFFCVTLLVYLVIARFFLTFEKLFLKLYFGMNRHNNIKQTKKKIRVYVVF